MKTLRLLLFASVMLFAFASGLACGHARPPDASKIVPPVTKAGCILLRAFVGGKVDEVCATAEDLAPLIGEILAEHEKNVQAGDEPPAAPMVAFTIAEPKKPKPKRRCAQWIDLRSREPPDGASDAPAVVSVDASRSADASPE